MSMTSGTVVAVQIDVAVAKNGGGSYPGWRLVIATQDGQMATIAKPIQSLKFNPQLKQQLEALSVGDEVTVIQEKNKAGFLDVKSITKGGFGDVPAPQLGAQDAPPQQAARPAYNGSTGRDFESKEERLAKQDYIIRQSSLATAVNYNKDLPVADIISIADTFFQYVKTGEVPAQEVKKTKKSVKQADDFLDDVPL